MTDSDNRNSNKKSEKPSRRRLLKATGAIDTASSPFANSVTQLAEMVVLNYLALHGEEAKFNTVLTNPGLGSGAAVAPYIAFNRIV